MKVALITHEGGGIASVTNGLAWSLARKGNSVTIFSPIAKSQPQADPKSNRLNVVRFPTLDVPPRTLWYQSLNLRRFARMLKDYDVIHGMSPEASFILACLRNKIKKPFVGTIHGVPRAGQKAFVHQPISSWTFTDFGYHILEFPFHELSINRILRDADHTTLCSFSVLEEFKAYRSLDMQRISVIYNGIDFEEIDNAKEFSKENLNQLSVMYAGRLFWYKGVMFLLEAFRHARKNFRNVHLNILGKGPLEKKIRKFIAQANLEDDVSFLGYVSRGRFLAELKKTDIVVSPSLYEAQSMFVLEAMACKKPVVAFDFPFTREIIEDRRNGLVVEDSNVQDLSVKMQELLSDEKLRLRLGMNAYDVVRERHNWDTLADKYLEVYEKTIDQF